MRQQQWGNDFASAEQTWDDITCCDIAQCLTRHKLWDKCSQKWVSVQQNPKSNVALPCIDLRCICIGDSPMDGELDIIRSSRWLLALPCHQHWLLRTLASLPLYSQVPPWWSYQLLVFGIAFKGYLLQVYFRTFFDILTKSDPKAHWKVTNLQIKLHNCHKHRRSHSQLSPWV